MAEKKLDYVVLRKTFNEQTIPIEELERRMRPGMFSEGGFLGKEESLVNVLCRDAIKLQELGVTYSQLANKLEELIVIALKTPRQITKMEDFVIQLTIYDGFQICPWTSDMRLGKCEAGGGPMYASIDWIIQNTAINRKMSGPGFIIHLIRAHHFFEGFNSPYRVDAQKLAQLFGLLK